MGRITGLFTENLGTKAMAVFMACALWTYAYYFSLRNETAENVPIEIKVPAGWSVMDDHGPGTLVEVNITYPTHAVERVEDALARGEFRAVFEPEVGPNETLKSFESRVQADDFRIPPGTDIRVDDWTPKVVSFRIAKRATQRLPVKLDIGEPPPGYRMQGEPWFSPREVEVKGPVGALSEAKYIETERITLSPPPLGQPRQLSIGLKQYVTSEDGRQYSVSTTDRIEYIVYLAQERKERTFEKVPVFVAHRPDYPHTVKLKTRGVDVIVRGPEGPLAELAPGNIQLSVNVNDLSPQSMPHLVDIHAQFVGVGDPTQFEIELELSQVGVDVQAATP